LVTIAVSYDGRSLPVRLPDENLISSSRAKPGTWDFASSGFDMRTVRGHISDQSRVLVVVNDGYRSTPTPTLFRMVDEALSSAGLVRVVVATGVHAPPGSDELEHLLGDYAHTYPVCVHDPDGECTDFGMLSDGTRLELNPLVDWADRIVLLGSVEPHFFAGYTGGAKQLLPGLASRKCTEANHRLATDSACRPMGLAANPVALAIEETALRFQDRLISVQAVMGPDGWTYFCGAEPDTLHTASRYAASVSQVQWPHPLDGLLAVMGSPLDRNLYQLQKGFENHLQAIKDGGWILLLSACRDGVGNEFFEPLASAYPRWQALPDWDGEQYSLGLHKLYRTARARETCRLLLHSTLSDEVVRRFYLEPVENPENWVLANLNASDRIGCVTSADTCVSSIVAY
jgi:nickel-dependent lactate racemase